jgi:hypothetical protein
MARSNEWVAEDHDSDEESNSDYHSSDLDEAEEEDAEDSESDAVESLGSQDSDEENSNGLPTSGVPLPLQSHPTDADQDDNCTTDNESEPDGDSRRASDFLRNLRAEIPQAPETSTEPDQKCVLRMIVGLKQYHKHYRKTKRDKKTAKARFVHLQARVYAMRALNERLGDFINGHSDVATALASSEGSLLLRVIEGFNDNFHALLAEAL